MPPARSDSEKDPNPLLFPFVRDFCRRQAPFSRPRRSPTRFSSRTPFARPDWRSARRRSGARQFFRSQQDFFEVQRGTALFIITISRRLIALSCLSLTWTSRQHFKKRHAEPGVCEPGNISEIVGAISRVTARQKISPVGAFFFFRQIPLKSPCRGHIAARPRESPTPLSPRHSNASARRRAFEHDDRSRRDPPLRRAPRRRLLR